MAALLLISASMIASARANVAPSFSPTTLYAHGNKQTQKYGREKYAAWIAAVGVSVGGVARAYQAYAQWAAAAEAAAAADAAAAAAAAEAVTSIIVLSAKRPGPAVSGCAVFNH